VGVLDYAYKRQYPPRHCFVYQLIYPQVLRSWLLGRKPTPGVRKRRSTTEHSDTHEPMTRSAGRSGLCLVSAKLHRFLLFFYAHATCPWTEKVLQ